MKNFLLLNIFTDDLFHYSMPIAQFLPPRQFKTKEKNKKNVSVNRQCLHFQ